MNLTSTSSEDLELFALEQVVEVRDLFDELLEEHASTLDEFSIEVVLHLHVLHVDRVGSLLGDGRDVAAGPPGHQCVLEGLELIVASLTGPFTLGVMANHRVLSHLANLDGVLDTEVGSVYLLLVFLLLAGTLHCLFLGVKGHDFLDQLGLSIVGSHSKVRVTHFALLVAIGSAVEGILGCSGHRNGSFTHKISALSSEPHRHLLLLIWILFLLGELLGLILLIIITACICERVLLLSWLMLLFLGVGVVRGRLLFLLLGRFDCSTNG